jgi:hypothetical protein
MFLQIVCYNMCTSAIKNLNFQPQRSSMPVEIIEVSIMRFVRTAIKFL